MRFERDARGGLEEVTTSNEPIDDEVARIFKAPHDPRATGRCFGPRGLELCLLPGNSGVELIIDGTKMMSRAFSRPLDPANPLAFRKHASSPGSSGCPD